MLTISLLSMFRRAVYRFSTVGREERRRLKGQAHMVLEQRECRADLTAMGQEEVWRREIVPLFG